MNYLFHNRMAHWWTSPRQISSIQVQHFYVPNIYQIMIFWILISLLVGVCLSDVANENCGNLLVWPGSHHILHQYAFENHSYRFKYHIPRRCKVGPHGALDIDMLSGLLKREPFSDSRPSEQVGIAPSKRNFIINLIRWYHSSME